MRLQHYFRAATAVLSIFCLFLLASAPRVVPRAPPLDTPSGTILPEPNPSHVLSPEDSSHVLPEVHTVDSVDDSSEDSMLPPQNYSCHSIGECKQCTDLERKTEHYCLQYGNKEPITCTATGRGSFVEPPTSTFRACARVKTVERAKFFQFQIFNIIISVCAACLLFWRQRKLATEQYRRMARRIGTAA